MSLSLTQKITTFVKSIKNNYVTILMIFWGRFWCSVFDLVGEKPVKKSGFASTPQR